MHYPPRGLKSERDEGTARTGSLKGMETGWRLFPCYGFTWIGEWNTFFMDLWRYAETLIIFAHQITEYALERTHPYIFVYFSVLLICRGILHSLLSI